MKNQCIPLVFLFKYLITPTFIERYKTLFKYTFKSIFYVFKLNIKIKKDARKRLLKTLLFIQVIRLLQ